MEAQVNLSFPKSVTASEAIEKRISSEITVINSSSYETAGEIVQSALDSAKEGTDTVIVSDLAPFNEIKTLLLKGLGTKILRNTKIKKKIGDVLAETSKEYNLHSAVPDGAEVFVSFDGMYSAFSCKYSEGRITILPSESIRLDEAIELGALSGKESEEKNSAVSVKENLRRSIASVTESGKTIAIAGVGMEISLLNVITAVGGSSETFRVTEVDTEGDSTDKQYYAGIAKKAKEKSGCDYGAAISDISSDGTLTICFADSDNAKVSVLYSLPGEDNSQFLGAAVIKIVQMMKEITTEGITVPEEEPVSVSKVPLIISIVCLVAAVIVCLVIGILRFSESKNPAPEATEAYSDETEDSYYGADTIILDGSGEVAPMFGADAYEDPFLTAVDALQDTILETLSTTAEYASTTYIAGDIYTSADDNGNTTVEQNYDDDDYTDDDSTDVQTIEVTAVDVLTDVYGDPISETKSSGSSKGKFVFTVYGWGHGVGMSQLGAKAMARNGSTCNEILGHYYPGTTIMVDPNTPMYVTEPDEEGKGGMTLLCYLCKTTKQEIGDDAPVEALKAQAVAAYTYAMFNGTFSEGQTIDYNFNFKGTKVESAVMDILGISSEDEWPHSRYVTYNGSYCDTVYCNSMAGKTASSKSVWGMNLRYLSGGVSSPEETEISTFEISVNDMKNLINDFAASRGMAADLGRNPARWLRIISHDGSLNDGIGYVNEIKVGGISVNGETFRTKVMKYQIRSHCFTIEYVKGE